MPGTRLLLKAFVTVWAACCPADRIYLLPLLRSFGTMVSHFLISCPHTRPTTLTMRHHLQGRCSDNYPLPSTTADYRHCCTPLGDLSTSDNLLTSTQQWAAIVSHFSSLDCSLPSDMIAFCAMPFQQAPAFTIKLEKLAQHVQKINDTIIAQMRADNS